MPKEKEKKTVNSEFVSAVSPQLGISFADDKYIKTSDGYVACIYVYGYPSSVYENWLNELTACSSNAVVTVDIIPQNSRIVKQNIGRSMEEQESRYNTARTNAEAIDAKTRYDELSEMYHEIENLGKVMDEICVRIYVPGKTLYELDKNVKDLILQLDQYKAGICLFETKNDYKALFKPLSVQNKGIYKKELQSVPSEILARGNPFHFSKLTDPAAFYWGETDTGGIVLLNTFYNDGEKRLSYNSIFTGVMGSGKSTTLKKMIKDRAIRGDYVRVFDVTGEYRDLILALGGRIVSCDGNSDSDSINMLQIFRAGETAELSYAKHMSKISTIYAALRPEASEVELSTFERLLSSLYAKWGILSAELYEDGSLDCHIIADIDNYDADSYPLWSDFRNFIATEKKELEKSRANESELERVTNIWETIDNLCTTYKSIFNRKTTINDSNIFAEQVLCFDVSNLVDMKSSIFDAQIISILSAVWAESLERGSKEKAAYERGEKSVDEVTRTLILGDETHRWLNAYKEKLVLMMSQYFREARKWFVGIALASQQLSDWVPDNISNQALQNIKTLFDLSTYKFIMLQDSSVMDKYRQVFGNVFTDREIEVIPTLEQGECILSIAGGQNLQFNVYASPADLALFSGGL